MHITPQTIEDMDLAHLEVARRVLGVSKAELCRASDVDQSTYQRWMKCLRGQPGGTIPQGRSLQAIRDALKQKLGESDAEGVVLSIAS